MKPAPFAYHAPGTVDEALELLTTGDGARILAGGQSLVQLMKFRTAAPSRLIDINRLDGLSAIERRDGELHLGALVRHQTLLEDALVADSCPLLSEATRFIGYQETRRRGTVGGSLAFAAPWGELTAVAVALDATVDVRSVHGERAVAAREFFRGPNETVLEADEMIVGARFPATAEGAGVAFHELSTRKRDYAQLAAGAVVSPDGSADLVLLCVAAAPLHIDASSALRDESAIDDLLADIEPLDDIEASASYRRQVAPVVARRALREAARRVQGGRADG